MPGRNKQELLVDHLKEEHCRLIIEIEKCLNPEENPNPAMPDLPLVPLSSNVSCPSRDKENNDNNDNVANNNTNNDSHVRSKRRRLWNGKAITSSNTLRSISGDAGIGDMEMVLQFTDITTLRFQKQLSILLQYVWGQYAMHNLGANSAQPPVNKFTHLWLEGALQ
jgi:hypothetical protein